MGLAEELIRRLKSDGPTISIEELAIEFGFEYLLEGDERAVISPNASLLKGLAGKTITAVEVQELRFEADDSEPFSVRLHLSDGTQTTIQPYEHLDWLIVVADEPESD